MGEAAVNIRPGACAGVWPDGFQAGRSPPAPFVSVVMLLSPSRVWSAARPRPAGTGAPGRLSGRPAYPRRRSRGAQIDMARPRFLVPGPGAGGRDPGSIGGHIQIPLLRFGIIHFRCFGLGHAGPERVFFCRWPRWRLEVLRMLGLLESARPRRGPDFRPDRHRRGRPCVRGAVLQH